MMCTFTRWLFFAVMLLVGVVDGAMAGCMCCGCSEPCNKICRLKCEEKKVKVICWGEQCEDFCLPNPGCPSCKQCEMVCDDCDKQVDDREPHGAPTKFVWRDWLDPNGAKMFTKKKLMQKIVTKKVKTYKWEVEDLCKKCEENAKSDKVEPGDKAPPPPKTDAKMK